VLHIGSDYELRRDQLWNLLRRLIQPEPNAFSEEVPSGFKNKFGKFFGTDHMLLAGWCSYAEKAKPDEHRNDQARCRSLQSADRQMGMVRAAKETEDVGSAINQSAADCGE
jgi:hypothetical protein